MIEIFGTIHQFDTLREYKLEGIEKEIMKNFYQMVNVFKEKDQNRLLEFQDRVFDRNFQEFQKEVKLIEEQLNEYIDQNFEIITKTEESLHLLRKFTQIMQKDSLKQGLQSKYVLLF